MSCLFSYELPNLYLAIELLLSASLRTPVCRAVRINDAQRIGSPHSAYPKQARSPRSAHNLYLADIEINQRSNCDPVPQVTKIYRGDVNFVTFLGQEAAPSDATETIFV
jgi:hypothetical protein